MMHHYSVEDNSDVDFFAALKEMQQDPSQGNTNDEDDSKCLITDAPLNAFHVELTCGHKFNYGPLYQAAYMLGGLQLRSLERELVQTGKMTYKEFHEAILRENYLPFELLRAKLLKLPLNKNQASTWKF